MYMDLKNTQACIIVPEGISNNTLYMRRETENGSREALDRRAFRKDGYLVESTAIDKRQGQWARLGQCSDVSVVMPLVK